MFLLIDENVEVYVICMINWLGLYFIKQCIFYSNYMNELAIEWNLLRTGNFHIQSNQIIYNWHWKNYQYFGNSDLNS